MKTDNRCINLIIKKRKYSSVVPGGLQVCISGAGYDKMIKNGFPVLNNSRSDTAIYLCSFIDSKDKKLYDIMINKSGIIISMAEIPLFIYDIRGKLEMAERIPAARYIDSDNIADYEDLMKYENDSISLCDFKIINKAVECMWDPSADSDYKHSRDDMLSGKYNIKEIKDIVLKNLDSMQYLLINTDINENLVISSLGNPSIFKNIKKYSNAYTNFIKFKLGHVVDEKLVENVPYMAEKYSELINSEKYKKLNSEITEIEKMYISKTACAIDMLSKSKIKVDFSEKITTYEKDTMNKMNADIILHNIDTLGVDIENEYSGISVSGTKELLNA